MHISTVTDTVRVMMRVQRGVCDSMCGVEARGAWALVKCLRVKGEVLEPVKGVEEAALDPLVEHQIVAVGRDGRHERRDRRPGE